MRGLIKEIYTLFRKRKVDERFILSLMDKYKDSLDKQNKRKAERILKKICRCLDEFKKNSDRDNYNKLLIRCINLSDAEIGSTRKNIDDLIHSFNKS